MNCVRCGNGVVVFFYEGKVARDVEIEDDIVLKWKVDEPILENRFYLCKECSKQFATLLKEFFGIKEVEDNANL